MGYRGDFGGQGVAEAYAPSHVEAVLRRIGVEVESETSNDFLCYCPFHNNRFSPSFSVSRTSGRYICFNAGCNETGNLPHLVRATQQLNEFQARRLILKAKTDDAGSFLDQLSEVFQKPEPFAPFSQDVIDNMKKTFWEYPDAVTYMVEQRGFEEDTLEHFEIGYSSKKDMIAVPMHDEMGMPIGIVGRPIKGHAFKNSKGLRKKETLWNAHRAKRAGEIGIVCEASFDAMRISQAGHPGVVATLGGHISKFQFEQLDRFFSTIIIMTDMDKKRYEDPCNPCKKRGAALCVGHNAGRDLGATIAAGLNKKKILWASYEQGVVYPDGAKDAGDMTDDQIRQCIYNAVSNYEYQGWGLY